MIVPSEENVILRVLSPGQHHVERVQDVPLGRVADDLGVALEHSQYEGGNWEIWPIKSGQIIVDNKSYKPSASPSTSTVVISPSMKTVRELQTPSGNGTLSFL